MDEELLTDLTYPLDFVTYHGDGDERFARVWKSLIRAIERLDKLDPECQTWSQYLLERCFNFEITEYGMYMAWFYTAQWLRARVVANTAFYKFTIATTTTASRYLAAQLPEGHDGDLSGHIQKFNPALHSYFCFGCPDDQKRDSQYLLAMIVFLSDGLLELAPGTCRMRQFFGIVRRLPLELQQVLANYAYGLVAPERGGFNNLPKNDIRWRCMLCALAV